MEGVYEYQCACMMPVLQWVEVARLRWWQARGRVEKDRIQCPPPLDEKQTLTSCTLPATPPVPQIYATHVTRNRPAAPWCTLGMGESWLLLFESFDMRNVGGGETYMYIFIALSNPVKWTRWKCE